jgi:hypothetical protein
VRAKLGLGSGPLRPSDFSRELRSWSVCQHRAIRNGTTRHKFAASELRPKGTEGAPERRSFLKNHTKPYNLCRQRPICNLEGFHPWVP